MLSYLYGELPLGLDAQVLEFKQLVGGASQPMESLSTKVAPSFPLGPSYIAEVCQSALIEGTLCNPSPQVVGQRCEDLELDLHRSSVADTLELSRLDILQVQRSSLLVPIVQP
jgi:hypothetical protein